MPRYPGRRTPPRGSACVARGSKLAPASVTAVSGNPRSGTPGRWGSVVTVVCITCAQQRRWHGPTGAGRRRKLEVPEPAGGLDGGRRERSGGAAGRHSHHPRLVAHHPPYALNAHYVVPKAANLVLAPDFYSC